MTRDLPLELVNILVNQSKFRPAEFVKIKLVESDSPILITTHSRDVIVDNGDEYIRAQTLERDTIVESAQLQDNQISAVLSGINVEFAGLILSKDFEAGEMTISKGFFDFETDELVGDIFTLIKGVISSGRFDVDPNEGKINVTLTMGNVFTRFTEVLGVATNPSEWKGIPGNEDDTFFDMLPRLASTPTDF